MEGLGLSEFPDLGLVVALAKFRPHGVEHHLGQGATSGIVLHLVIVQPDSLPSLIVVQMLGLLVLGGTTSRPPTGLFLDFKPGVHILGKEALLALWKMPHFMDCQQHIAFLHGLLEFRRTPGPGQGPLVGCVGTTAGLVEERQVQLLLDTGSAQGEGQFIPRAIGQDGMVQVGWREHGTFGQTKVRAEVERVGRILEVTQWITCILTDPRVEAGVVVIANLFPLGGVGDPMQLHHIGASTE